jgi:hypothetical protein
MFVFAALRWTGNRRSSRKSGVKLRVSVNGYRLLWFHEYDGGYDGAIDRLLVSTLFTKMGETIGCGVEI